MATIRYTGAPGCATSREKAGIFHNCVEYIRRFGRPRDGNYCGKHFNNGFGIDSFIEVTSGSVLLWRMSVDSDANRRERNEKWALRIVGACFLLLAAYVVYDSILDLWSKRAPEHSIEGIVLACVSLVVMPVLSRA
jgi:hypothetical protein